MPGQSSDRVGRVIQPVISGVPSAAEHDGVVVLAQFADGVRLGLCSATLVAPNLVVIEQYTDGSSGPVVRCERLIPELQVV